MTFIFKKEKKRKMQKIVSLLSSKIVFFLYLIT